VQALLILYGCAVLVSAVAAVTDFRTGLIPNWLTLPPIVIAPIAHGIMGGKEGLLLSAAGVVACGVVPYLIFRLKGMAGGDVKLFAAIGGIVGPFVGIEAQFYAFCFAALFALGRLAWHGKLLRTLSNTLYLGLNPILPKRKRKEITPELMHQMRLGPTIFAGTATAAFINLPPMWGFV
jgi:prepilin peptidase CpaA